MSDIGNEPTVPPPPAAVLLRAAEAVTQLLGRHAETTGWEERGDARHVTWTWPGGQRKLERSFRYFEAGSRQYLVMRHGRCTGWLEGKALLSFPGIEAMIIGGMGLAGLNPREPGLPPLQ
jgi:hypothetical protein